MVTILIDIERPLYQPINLGLWAFNILWRDILNFISCVLDTLSEVAEAFIKFVRRNGKAVAYLIKRWFNGRKTRTEIDEIDEGLCPDKATEALKEGKEVRVYNIK